MDTGFHLLKQLTDRFLESGGTDQMSSIVDFFRSNTQSVTDEGIAYLAKGLASSGQIVSPPGEHRYFDIASTGGPSSLSTLIAPLCLSAMGISVCKLGVPGRPAGGIDAMAQVPAFRYTLTEDQLKDALLRSRFVHFLATGLHAPADGKLFAHRKTTNAVNVPELAMASLLSKKIAVGVTTLGLDVRVSEHGNFGTTWKAARANSRRIARVGEELGISVTCFLSDGSRPYQPYIGRGESLIALDQIIRGVEGPWLDHHSRQCFAMANSVAQANETWEQIREKLGDALEQHLNAQGTNRRRFKAAVDKTRNQHRISLSASSSGFVGISLRRLRTIFIAFQEACKSASDPFPDPIGVILSKNSGDYCLAGEELASIRCHEEHSSSAIEGLKEAIKVSTFPGESGFLEKVIHV